MAFRWSGQWRHTRYPAARRLGRCLHPTPLACCRAHPSCHRSTAPDQEQPGVTPEDGDNEGGSPALPPWPSMLGGGISPSSSSGQRSAVAPSWPGESEASRREDRHSAPLHSIGLLTCQRGQGNWWVKGHPASPSHRQVPSISLRGERWWACLDMILHPALWTPSTLKLASSLPHAHCTGMGTAGLEEGK